MTLKTLNEKFKELKNSLEAIENANNDFWRTRKESYLLTIIGQARVLAGLDGKNMNPLLISLMNDLNIYPIIYSLPPKTALDKIQKDFIANIYCDRTWFVDKNDNLYQCNLKNWLEFPYQYMDISTGRKFYTRNDILRGISDKHGGGHYDPDISEYVEILERYSCSNNLNGVKIFLLDVASAIVYSGTQLLNIYYCQKENIDYLTNINYINTQNKFRKFNFTGGFATEIQIFGQYMKE